MLVSWQLLQVVAYSSSVARTYRQRREELLEHSVEEEAVRNGHRSDHTQAHLTTVGRFGR